MPRRKPTDKVSIEGRTSDEDRLLSRAIEEAMQGDRYFFEQLSDHERAAFVALAAAAISSGEVDAAVCDALWEVDYIRKPVDVLTFVESPEYLGNLVTLVDEWKRDLAFVFAPGSTVMEWIFTGGLGGGKSFCASVALAYTLYRLSCLRSPQRYYGLSENSPVVFGIYSVTLAQASNALYTYLRGFVEFSPYFQAHYPHNTKLESEIEFPGKNVSVKLGSKSFHSIGLNVLNFALDEANFLQTTTDKQSGKITGQAYDLYEGTTKRIATRFIRPGGTVPGVSFLVSSKSHQAAFTENRIRKLTGLTEVEHVRGPILPRDPTSPIRTPTAYVSSYPNWIRFPALKDRPKTSTHWFKVQVGDAARPSRLLQWDEPPDDPDLYTIDVPREYYPEFDRDVDAGLRDIAGVAAMTIYPFVRDGRALFDAVDPNRPNPFPAATVAASTDTTFTLDRDPVTGFSFAAETCHVEASRWVPNYYPGLPRHIHVDLAVNGDAASITMGCSPGWRSTTRVVGGTRHVSRAPTLFYDFTLRIVNNPGHQIDFARIRAFIVFLSQLFPISGVTYDGYMSVGEIQMLKAEGLNAFTLSVDRSPDAYMTLRTALHERRVSVPNTGMDGKTKRPTNHWFVREMQFVQFDSKRRKVDHPDVNPDNTPGSKDVIDGVAAVALALSEGLARPSPTPPAQPPGTIAAKNAKAWDRIRRDAGATPPKDDGGTI